MSERPKCNCHDEAMTPQNKAHTEWACEVKNRRRQERRRRAAGASVADVCRPVFLGGPIPTCSRHDEPMRWNKDFRKTAGGWWGCSEKQRARDRARWLANPEKGREWNRRWREASGRRYTLHGITREGALGLYEFQGRVCAGCDEPFPFEKLQVDHDHSCCPGEKSCGSCIRGLLCKSCNARDALEVKTEEAA